GATVHELHCEHDGARINVNCGATHLEPLRAAVAALHAAGKTHVVGVAFDGDADRALFIDERASTITGDHILYALACDAHARGDLQENRVVGTVMSNIGLERALRAVGIDLERAAVGDRYVLATMREHGVSLGGEQSGHVIDLRSNTTGDGTMTAFALLGLMARTKHSLRELTAPVVEAPQILQNIRVFSKASAEREGVRKAVAHAERSLAGRGRILVRPSGTEPLVRVMVEGDDRAEIEEVAKKVSAAIAQAEKEIDRAQQTNHLG
ncbi:MAG TPA: phosphoglucosamine mutase, partial [Candidatus Dormibacteraeota bacterium]|nr:phosphoglucosamine mutase [Candidatus Dormibacteraeota bacterium]